MTPTLWSLSVVALKVTGLLTVAVILDHVLRRGPGRVRHLLWSGALVGTLLVSPLSWLLPGWELGLRAPAPPAAEDVPSHPYVPAPPPADLQRLFADSPLPQGEGLGMWASSGMYLEAVLAGLWVLGALVVGGRFLLARVRLARLAGRTRPVSDPAWLRSLDDAVRLLGLRRPVRLGTTAEVTVPMAGGVRRPTIFLPLAAAEWSCGRRRLVLLHELVHVQRGDLATELAAQLACALYWWNPLVWHAQRRLHAEREAACDETVIAHGARPSEYASHLLDIAQSLAARRPVAALAMVQRSQLEGRLMNILETSHPRRKHSLLHLATLLAVAALTLGLATVRLWGAPPELDEPQVRKSSWAIEHFGDDDFFLSARVDGDVEFAEGGGVEHLAADARVEIETEQEEGAVQRLVITPDDSGAPRYAFTVDGEARPWDADARRWADTAFDTLEHLKEIGELRAETGRLRAEIGRVRAEEGRMRAEAGRVRAEEGRMRAELGRVHAGVGRHHAEIGRIRAEVGRMRAEAGRVRAEEGRMRAEIGRHLAAIHRQEARRERHTEHLDAEEREEIAAEIARHEAEIVEMEARIADFDVAERVAAIEARIAEFDEESRVAAVEREIDERETAEQIAAIEARIAEFDVAERVAAIEARIAEFDTEARVRDLEARIEKLAAEERIRPLEENLERRFEELRRISSEM